MKFPHIPLIFIALAGLLAFVLWRMQIPAPVLSKDGTDIDSTIVGDSATDKGNDGPAYMGANWAWPMPLALWNPSSTVRN